MSCSAPRSSTLRTDNAIEKKILWACRAGDVDVLRTAAYQLSDELYTTALAVLEDDSSAQSAVIETWRRVLGALQRWRFAGGLRGRALNMLGRVLSQMVDPPQAEQIAEILERAKAGSSEAYAAPDELVTALIRLSDRMAPLIAEARQRRKRGRRLAVAAGLVAIGVLIGLSVAFYNRALIARNPQLQFETLQQRIVAAQLRMVVQQAEMELVDPLGAQVSVRDGYQRIGLVLEEIINAANLRQANRLRFVKDRIASQQLIQLARQAAYQSSGRQRERLMMVVLVLEEAANL